MVGTWERLTHVELSSDGDTLDSGTFTAKKNLKVIVCLKGTADITRGQYRFNADTGSNYAARRSSGGSSDSTDTSDTSLQFTNQMSLYNSLTVTKITNIATEEKLCINHTTVSEATGAGAAPKRHEVVGKWTNTSNQITRIQVYNDDSGDYEAGSYITVWGASDDVVTDEKTTLTNIEAGTQYRETDTRKIYRAGTPTADYETDFTSNTGWTTSGSQFTVDATTDERLEYALKRTGNTNDYVYYDLGSGNVSDTKWVLRFHMVHTSESGNNAKNTVINMGISSITGGLTSTQDFIGLNLQFGQDNQYRAQYNDGVAGSGSSAVSAFSTSITGTDNYYVEIKRTSATAMSVEFFSDSDYSTSVEQETLTITSGTSGLRYLGIQLGYGSADDDILNGYLDDIKFYNGVTSTTEIVFKERGTA